jgi:hypothetical protein
LDSSDLMDQGDSMSSDLVHDASPSVMADTVNASDAPIREYCVIYFVMLGVHCLRQSCSDTFNSFRDGLPGA